MTTGTGPDRGAGERRWAAEQLGVAEDAPRDEARRAYLRQLRDWDFVPPPSLRHALGVLEGRPVPPGAEGEWLLEEEGRLRDEVEALAGEFFSLAAAERRRRHAELVSRCRGVPPLAARLRALEAGLAVGDGALPPGGSLEGELAGELLEAFPRPPLARAAARQAFLRRVEDPAAAEDRRPWEAAARSLRAEWPALAGLDPEWVGDVATLSKRLWRRDKARQPAGQAVGTAGGAKTPVPWWALMLVGGILSAVFRGVNSSNDSSSSKKSPSGYSAPAGGVNPLPLPDVPPLEDLFDPAQYDVEAVGGRGSGVLRFTPRPGAGGREPVLIGEAMLRLRGVSRERINALLARAKQAGKARP